MFFTYFKEKFQKKALEKLEGKKDKSCQGFIPFIAT